MSEMSTTKAIQSLLSRFAAGEAAAKAALIELAHDRLLVLARRELADFPAVRREEESAAVLGLSYKRLDKMLDDVRPATALDFFNLAATQMSWVLLDLARQGKRGAEPRPAVINDPDGPPDVGKRDPGASQAGTREDLMTAIAKLPEKEREVVNLIFFGGLTQRDAAEVLDVHTDTVKERWARARVKLAHLLKAYAPPARTASAVRV